MNSFDDNRNKRSRHRNVFVGVVLIVLGAIFLANNFNWFDWGKFWPVVLILLGLLLIAWRIDFFHQDDGS